MTLYIKITDTMTGAQATCATGDIEATLAPWYPDAPADVVETISDFAEAVRAGRPSRNGPGQVSTPVPQTYELEAALGIEWEWATLQVLSQAERDAFTAWEAARTARDAAVRAAMADGMPRATIAEATGISLPRLYQIRDGRR